MDSHSDPTAAATTSRGRVGWVVAASLAVGLVAALLLAAAPVVAAREAEIGGAVLCGFALGWAMLTVLSVRFTDQPQRWAAAPALLMGLSGALLIGFGSSVGEVLGWVLPPAVLSVAVLDGRPGPSASAKPRAAAGCSTR